MRFRWAFRRISALVFFIFLLSYSFFKFKSEEDVSDYEDSFDAAKDALFVENYLKMMQLGRAPARPVVEKRVDVDENYWCFLERPKNVHKPRRWLKMAQIDVYSAYFDDRENSLFPENAAVQVLVMSNHSIESKISIYCNIFTSSSYSTVKGYIREIWQAGWDPRDSFQVPSLVTCPISKRVEAFDYLHVSLTRRRCKNSQDSIEVILKPKELSQKKDVAVCVKGLDYQEDISGRLLEWIEMQFLFGVDAISIYHFYLTENTHKVLDYFKEHKNLSVIPLILPPGNTNAPIERSRFLKENRAQKRRHELLPYNDCFYSYIHTHRYVLIIDIDEIVVPIESNNYGDLLRSFEAKTFGHRPSSISSRNVFKFPSNFTLFPRHQYMISNRKRSRKTSPRGEYGKSFCSTSTVATVFNHFALHKLSPSVAKSQYFTISEALKMHYKSECPWESRHECHQLEYDVIQDRSLDRFEEALRKRVNEIAAEISL